MRKVSMARVMGLVGTLGIGSGLGWLVLQMLHRTPSGAPALDAPRETVDLMSSGEMVVYVDRRASGRPLVLLHGVHPGASALDVQSFFSAYRGKRPVFAPDLPGFGASDRHEHLYSSALYTFAIMQLLQRIASKDEPADVVAMSLSCEFAARAARDRPDLFNSLTLVSPTGFEASESKRRPRSLVTPHVAEMVYAKVTVPALVLYGRPEASFARLAPFLARHEHSWRSKRIMATRGVPRFELRGEMFRALEDLWSEIAHALGPVERVSHTGFPHVTTELS